MYHVSVLFGIASPRKILPQFVSQLKQIQRFEATMEFVKKTLIRIGRHYNVTYGKWIMDESTWSEFVPQAEGENQRKKQAERKIIVGKYGQ